MAAPPVFAQGSLTSPPQGSGRDFQRTPDAGDALRREDRSVLQLPAPPEPGSGGGIPAIRFRLQRVIVEGVTAIPPEAVARVVAPYQGREVSSEDLEALRQELTLLYIRRGYVNSGAVVPDQAVADGTVRIQVREGELTEIEVRGNQQFRSAYLERRVRRFAGTPLHIAELQNGLVLLQQDPRIRKLDANLRPAARPGQSTLELTVLETTPYRVELLFDNYEPPSAGSLHGQATVQHRNLTGSGDVLSFGYGRTQGLFPQIDTWYALPLSASDTTLSVRYRKNDSEQVEAPFDELDVKSKSDVYQLSLRHPLHRTAENRLDVSVSGEYRRDRTYLLGERYSFSEGFEDGEATTSVVRLAPEWVHRGRSRVVAASARFSFGTEALGATEHGGDTPDSQFFSWLGQIQWAEVLGGTGIQSLARADLQWAGQRLLPAEKIALGGRHAVRGYRQNLYLRDNAFLASWEVRIPLVRDRAWADALQLAPFFDYGTGWNTDTNQPPDRTITSAGVGLRWSATLDRGRYAIRPHAELYWGHPFKDVDSGGEYDLQDDGVFFQLGVAAF
jgi:hemolysin activation/secretion protein